MEFPSKRSNYTLLSQFSDKEVEDQQLREQSKFSGGGAGKNQGRGFFDWDGDNRLQQGGGGGGGGGGRVTNLNFFPSIGIQRQSSGSSSFEESSLSGEYHVPMNDSEMFLGHSYDEDGGGELRRLKKGGIEASVSSSCKSWAQQTEECYQLQQALALRLSSDATCADDLTFLDQVIDVDDDESVVTRSSAASSQALSHRFWVNGCLSYFDKVPDGFYLIHGMDPYVWTVCTDVQENGRVPSIESLKAVIPSDDSSIEVVLSDKCSDSGLEELVSRVTSLSHSCISTEEVVDQLAKCVCNRMGGAASTNEDGLFSRWKDCCKILKDRSDSIVLPLGSLSIGLCRHRALLFKVLADAIDLPCRIAKGCKYCRRDDASSALVRFGLDREYLVDLIEKPGCLCEPDSLYNGPSSISMSSSPLRFPKFRPVETNENFRSWAKQYILDCQSLALMFGDTPSGIPINQNASTDPLLPKHFDKKQTDMNNLVPISGINDSVLLVPQIGSELNEDDGDRMLRSLCTQNVASPIHLVKDLIPLKQPPSCGHKDVQSVLALSDSRINVNRDLRFIEGVEVVPSKSITEFSLDVEGLEIPWSDLVIKDKIGAGSFGTVHRADWHGSDVAVKILMEQDFHVAHVKDFLREVALMKRLRHPNIVLFMGAVTQPPNLSIVTEYLSRGSLFRFLHKSGARALLDERRRLSMAYDVADGMNYLHRRNPPIVHRDLKSPNLLVDKKFTVKVCDFGLSRLKENTFLSSKTGAGTPEWMAPEVLRDEPSNEKSDVYSFGVILWELVTLQLPWSTLNPAQVVAAVAFNNRRLEIPSNVNPQVAELIEACWANEPWMRPSFSDIMESLKPLIRPPTLPLHADIPQSPILTSMG